MFFLRSLDPGYKNCIYCEVSPCFSLDFVLERCLWMEMEGVGEERRYIRDTCGIHNLVKCGYRFFICDFFAFCREVLHLF